MSDDRLPVIIPLNKQFVFQHGPYDEFKDNVEGFIGRDEIIQDMLQVLINTKQSRGCYLVAGNRGIGKTSVINRVFNFYQKTRNKCGWLAWMVTWFDYKSKRLKWRENGNERPVIVRVNLGHSSSMSTDDIFSNIINILTYELKQAYVNTRILFRLTTMTSILLLLWAVTYTLNLFSDQYLITGFLTTPLLEIAQFTSTNDIFPLNISLLHVALTALIVILFRTLFKRTNTFLLPSLFTKLNDLQDRMAYSRSYEANIGLLNNSSFKRSGTRLPLELREKELLLISALKHARRLLYHKPDIIFVFDEIDKLSTKDLKADTQGEPYSKIEVINSILGSLKNLVTSSEARFFFISGTNVLDDYQSERGHTNSLFESLFDRVFYIPSFLTDPSDGDVGNMSSMIEVFICRKIMGCCHEYAAHGIQHSSHCHKNEYDQFRFSKLDHSELAKLYNAKQIAGKKIGQWHNYVLRNFANYLTFHSWGNPKRLNSLFEAYVKTKQNVQRYFSDRDDANRLKDHECYIVIEEQDLKRFLFATEIFTLFQHNVSRQIASYGDRLMVSALAATHFIIKFQRHAFSNDMLYRLSETYGVNRSPFLNQIMDLLIRHVLRPYVRRVRNGLFRYRFNMGFEQEIRYISYINDSDGAAFSYSKGSMEYIKRYYNELISGMVQQKNEDQLSLSMAYITLGDLNSLELLYDVAGQNYASAVTLLMKSLNENISSEGKLATYGETLFLYVEAMLKSGDLEERRQNYNRAASIYYSTERTIERVIGLFIDQNESSDKKTRKKQEDPLVLSSKENFYSKYLLPGDSKWDILKQPYWAAKFLELKRGPSALNKEERPYFYNNSDTRFDYRIGVYYLMRGDFQRAIESFSQVIRLNGKNSSRDRERSNYLVGCSYVRIVETLLQYLSIQEADSIKNNKLGHEFRFTDKVLKDAIVKTLKDKLPKNITRNGSVIEASVILLQNAAKLFADVQLLNHAATVHLKAICYAAAIKEIIGGRKNDALFKLVKTSYNYALKYYEQARQIRLDHFVNICRIRDGFDAPLFSLEFNGKNVEDLEWHLPMNIQKLEIAKLWFLDSMLQEISFPEFPSFAKNPTFNTFSTRFNIQLKWRAVTYSARKLFKKYVEVPLLDNTLSEDNISEIYDEIVYLSSLTYNIMENIRFISHNSQDIFYPTKAELCMTQWKILVVALNVTKNEVLMGADYTHINDDDIVDLDIVSRKIQSILLARLSNMRNNSLFMQKDIPPSHFHLLQVKDKSNQYLANSDTMADNTSQMKKYIMQTKYYMHDDYFDSEFHLDWTLNHTFLVRSQQLKEERYKNWIDRIFYGNCVPNTLVKTDDTLYIATQILEGKTVYSCFRGCSDGHPAYLGCWKKTSLDNVLQDLQKIKDLTVIVEERLSKIYPQTFYSCVSFLRDIQKSNPDLVNEFRKTLTAENKKAAKSSFESLINRAGPIFTASSIRSGRVGKSLTLEALIGDLDSFYAQSEDWRDNYLDLCEELKSNDKRRIRKNIGAIKDYYHWRNGIKVSGGEEDIAIN